MAVNSGTLGVVKIGANVVAATTAWTLIERVLKIPAHTSGSGQSTDLVGRRSADGSITCILDEDDANGQVAMAAGATVALELYYDGEGTGNVKRAFNAIIESVDESMGVDNANGRTFTYWTNELVDRTDAT